MNRSKNCGTFTQWNTTQQKKKKKELLLFVTAWMELESIMLSEVSQVVKDKYHMISHIGRWNLVKQTNEQMTSKDRK